LGEENNFRVKFGLAVSLEKNKDRALALDIYRELNQFPNLTKEQREKLGYHLGSLLLKLHQEEEGKIHLEGVLKSSADKKIRSKSFASIADFYYKKKFYEEARKNYFSSIQEDLNNIHARIGLTRTLRGLGRDIAPTDIYEQYVDFANLIDREGTVNYDANHNESSNLRKDIFANAKRAYESKDYRKAIGLYQKVISHSKSSLDREKAYYYLAECYFSIGELDNSLKNIQEVLNNNNHSLDQAAQFRKAIIYYEQKKYKEAASVFNIVIEQYPVTQFTNRAKDYRKEILSILGEEEKYEANPDKDKDAKKEIIPEDSEDE
jgi:tetratricopeptide (TPR) repeat protein